MKTETTWMKTKTTWMKAVVTAFFLVFHRFSRFFADFHIKT
ncbi:hypothetical protein [Neobacillus niacini]